MRRRMRRRSPLPSPADLGVVERDGAGGRLDQPVDAADDGRFAGARRPDQRHHLAVRHVEVDALERQIAGAIALGQPLDTQHSPRPPASRRAGPAHARGAARHALSVGLLAGVFDAVGRVDLADHVPVLLVGDGDELALLLEFLLQRGAFPIEGEERFLDLGRRAWDRDCGRSRSRWSGRFPTCRSSGSWPDPPPCGRSCASSPNWRPRRRHSPCWRRRAPSCRACRRTPARSPSWLPVRNPPSGSPTAP